MYYNILAITDSHQQAQAPPAMAAVLKVGESVIHAIVDTGAQANVAPLCLIHPKDASCLQATSITIRPFGSGEIAPCGVLHTDTTWKNSTISTKWIIIDDETLPRHIDPIISRSLAQSLGLATLHCDLVPYRKLVDRPFNHNKPLPYYPSANTYAFPVEATSSAQDFELDPGVKAYMRNSRFQECFEGLGCLKDYQVRLYLKPGAKPYVAPPRSSALYFEAQINQAIVDMLANGVIEPHHGPADWVANLAVAFKEDGTLRITVDLRGLNAEIRDTRVPIPTPETIKAKLAGCKIFSKLDFTQSFHQLQLHPESRNLTVFRSGGKLYRYTRVSMGLKPTSGELAAACQHIFGHLENVYTIHDDVIIAAKTKQQHDQAMVKFLEQVKRSGMTLNPKKCKIGAKEITFWGVRVSEGGISPDKEKIRTLREARAPQSKRDVVSFLCMARSHQDFIPSIAGRTSNLRALTKKFAPFRWEEAHQKEFEGLREALSDNLKLAFFTMEKKTHIIVDAHRDGLGAILVLTCP